MALVQTAKNVVRRSSSVMQLYRQADTPLCKGKLNFDKTKMDQVIAENRAVVASFGDWIDPAAMAASTFQYGLSPEWATALQRPSSAKLSYSDILAYIASASSTDTSYLEVGVSVGKNFWQVLNHVRGGFLAGLDIENINPPLASKLTPVSSEPIASSFQSVRKSGPKLECFEFAPRQNRVEYHAGDVFDPAIWQGLKGRKFNLIFSDAFHHPEAVLFEWKQLIELDLLDRSGFTILWDDLVSKSIRNVFNEIVSDCIRLFGMTRRNACLMHVSGWVGEYEAAHPIGIVSSQGFVT